MNRLSRILTSFRRPYRLIPELDVLSDEEGQALVAGFAAQRRSMYSSPTWGRSYWIKEALGSLFIATIISLCFQIPFIPLMFLGLALGIAAMAMSIHESLPNRVRARLREDWCQGCAYPLYELPACTGPMECPRCGRPCIARESIRAAADLLACDIDAHAARLRRPPPKIVPSCSCGYPLHGLPAAEARVCCPECGRAYRAHGSGFVAEDDDDLW